MTKLYYKNYKDYTVTPDPIERRQNISKEIVRHADYMPKTLSYEDIDRTFKEWVENDIEIIQDGVKLPTMVLYSNQRFSEYMQTWKYTDENNNVRLNFKTVTRENNPSHGTILGETYNIPGNRFYTFRSIQAVDEIGREYRIEYKMKQPTPVDLVYTVSILTNRYVSINDFNESVNKLFKAKQVYLCPNGHYMSIILENINDESEYNIEDRQFFSQSIKVRVRGYILKEDDFRVEENPVLSIVCFDGDTAKRRKPTIELFEYDPCIVETEYENYYKKLIEIDVDLSFCYPCKGKTKFTMDEDFILTKFDLKEPNNIIEDTIKLYVNGDLITDNLMRDAFEGYVKCDEIPTDINHENTTTYNEMPEEYDKYYKYIIYNNEYYVWHQIHFSDGDEIVIETKRINRYNNTGGFIITGYNRFVVLEKEEVLGEKVVEVEKNKINPSEECIIPKNFLYKSE